MKLDTHRAAQIIAAALIVTAITQLVYVTLGGGGISHIAYPIWRIETLSALVVALFAFVILKQNPLVGGAWP